MLQNKRSPATETEGIFPYSENRAKHSSTIHAILRNVFQCCARAAKALYLFDAILISAKLRRTVSNSAGFAYKYAVTEMDGQVGKKDTLEYVDAEESYSGNSQGGTFRNCLERSEQKKNATHIPVKMYKYVFRDVRGRQIS